MVLNSVQALIKIHSFYTKVVNKLDLNSKKLIHMQGFSPVKVFCSSYCVQLVLSVVIQSVTFFPNYVKLRKINIDLFVSNVLQLKIDVSESYIDEV